MSMTGRALAGWTGLWLRAWAGAWLIAATAGAQDAKTAAERGSIRELLPRKRIADDRDWGRIDRIRLGEVAPRDL